jgi:L-lactate dehydrogenase complex protein LldE
VPPRVALFATCLGDRFFADAAADAVRLLRHLGVEVEVPAGQTCCGQPAFNTGHRREAARMAAHTAEVFARADYVVLPSGSCAAMLRSHAPELVEGTRAPLARSLADRSRELAEFIVQVLGVSSVGMGLEGRRFAYHHGCHALRELGVRDEPLTLLEGAGARVDPWPAAEECCGFGGLFSVKMPGVSGAMADRKLDTLPDGVEAVVSADGGCLLHLGGRAARRGSTLPCRHIASVLWEATGVPGGRSSSSAPEAGSSTGAGAHHLGGGP